MFLIHLNVYNHQSIYDDNEKSHTDMDQSFDQIWQQNLDLIRQIQIFLTHFIPLSFCGVRVRSNPIQRSRSQRQKDHGRQAARLLREEWLCRAVGRQGWWSLAR